MSCVNPVRLLVGRPYVPYLSPLIPPIQSQQPELGSGMVRAQNHGGYLGSSNGTKWRMTMFTV